MAEDKNKIPNSIIELATQKGFNAIRFISHIKDYGDVYSIYFDDGTPRPIPFGMPKYILKKDDSLVYFDDKDFRLSRLLNS